MKILTHHETTANANLNADALYAGAMSATSTANRGPKEMKTK